MASPGWYPDPEDANSQRYYDGSNWTDDRQPLGYQGGSEQVDPPTQAAPAWRPPGEAPAEDESHTPAPGQSGQPGYSGTTAALPTQTGGPFGTPAPSYGAPPSHTEQLPSYGGQPAYQPPPDFSQQPTYQQPGGYPPGAGYPGGAPPAARRRSKLPLIIAICVVLVAGLAVGGYFLLRPAAPTLTYDGKSIDKPADVLTQAETTVNALVTKRHGAKSGDTRCYYAVPTTPAAGAKKTDIDHALRCGPVLFVDGTVTKNYLTIPLTGTVNGDKATLQAASSASSPDPAAAPGGFTLKRPDGKTAPSGTGGLTVPAPPPADKDVLTASDILTQSVPDAPTTAAMGGATGGVQLTKLGAVKRYGSGDDARSAPTGQKLIAFQSQPFPGDSGDSGDLSSETTIVIDGATARPVPATSTGQYVIVAAPTSAKTVDLVLNDSGVAQTLSLLDGKPGAGNIVVLGRTNKSQTISHTQDISITYSKPVVYTDGQSGSAQNITITLATVSLMYSYHGTIKPSSPANAILVPDITYTDPHAAGTFGLDPGWLQFTPTGGTAIAAKNAATDADHYADYFEVPGNMTTGTLTVSGSFTTTFSNSTDTYVTTVTTPLSIPVSIAAN